MSRVTKTPKPAATTRPISLKLSLMENSYGFLNQSLKHYRKASRDIHEWPFAILHITQSIELMIKQVLRDSDRVLIFEDVDHPKRTVSLEQALARLEAVTTVKTSEKEKVNIKRASELRNKIVHYEFELNRFECKKTYARLFEFVHFFHARRFRREIHVHIAKEHWGTEARLMKYFRENFVIYNDIEMPKDAPAEIVAAQDRTHIHDGEQKYARIRYGDKAEWGEVDPAYADSPCHDCGVIKGQYHAEGCDVERCPKCVGQFFCCSCDW